MAGEPLVSMVYVDKKNWHADELHTNCAAMLLEEFPGLVQCF